MPRSLKNAARIHALRDSNASTWELHFDHAPNAQRIVAGNEEVYFRFTVFPENRPVAPISLIVELYS